MTNDQIMSWLVRFLFGIYIVQFVALLRLVRTRSAIRNGWTIWHVLGGELFALLAVIVTLDAWTDIANIAVGDPEASHIFLVPFIVGWLVWVRRDRLRQCVPQGTSIGPILILIGWAMVSYGFNPAGSVFSPIIKPLLGACFTLTQGTLWLLTIGKVWVNLEAYKDGSIQTFFHGGAVMVLVGAVLSFAGHGVLRRFLPAFIVLLFLIPSPQFIRQQIAHPLESAQAFLTQQSLDLLGVVVQRSGNVMYIKGHPVAVAEACNGLRMVFTLVLVCYAFAFGTPLRTYVRVIIVLASPIAALFCNVVRMVPTVYLYGFSDGKVMGVNGKQVADLFHDIAGWVMLVIAFLMLMSIIRILRWAMIPVTRYTLAYD